MLDREQKEEGLTGKRKYNDFYFRKQRVSSHPDCGFFALGITRDQLIEKFLEIRSEASHRQRLTEEIRSAFMTKKIKDEEWEVLSTAQAALQTQIEVAVQRVNALVSEFIKTPMDVDCLIPYLKELHLKEPVAARLSKLRLKLLEIEQVLADFYKREETFVRYINHYKAGLPLGYQSALLFVEATKWERERTPIELSIWQQEKDNSSLLFIASEGESDSDRDRYHVRQIHLLYDDTFTHFDLLIERSQWKKREAYFSNEPLKAEEAFFHLLAPQQKSFLTLPPQVMAARVVPYLTFKELGELANVSRMCHREYQHYYLNDFLLATPYHSREKKLRLACMTANLGVIRQMELDVKELSAEYSRDSCERREARSNRGYHRRYSKYPTVFNRLNKNSSPIQIAFHYGHQRVLDYFYEIYFKPFYTEDGVINYRKKDEDGSLLQWAIICRRPIEEIEAIIHAFCFPHASHGVYNKNEKYHHEAYDHDLLYYAILSQKVPVLRALLSCMEDNALQHTHQRLLKTAIQMQSPEMVVLLLEKGARVNLDESNKLYDLSPLWYAARTGQIDIIQLLLEKGANATLIEKETNFSSEDSSGRSLPSDTALLAAVDSGSVETVRLLVEAGARRVINRLYKNTVGYHRLCKAPLSTAVSANHFDMVKLLVEQGADPFQIEEKTSGPACPFLSALNQPDDRILRFLLENSNVNNISKLDALYALLGEKYVGTWCEREEETLLLLLQKGANANQKAIHYPHFPLVSAIERGNAVEYIEFLLKHGADANLVDKKKETPIFQLMRSFLHHRHYTILQKKELIDVLFRYGAEKTLHHRNAQGETLLYIACDEDIFNLLLQKGLDPRVASETGDTLLHNHAQGSAWGIVCALINACTLEDLNRKNKDGETPLALAARAGHIEILKLLIAVGADVNEADHQGQTPLALVIKEYDQAVKQYERFSDDEECRRGYKKRIEENYAIIIILLNAAAHYTHADVESWPCTPDLKKLLEEQLAKEAALSFASEHYSAKIGAALSSCESVFSFSEETVSAAHTLEKIGRQRSSVSFSHTTFFTARKSLLTSTSAAVSFVSTKEKNEAEEEEKLSDFVSYASMMPPIASLENLQMMLSRLTAEREDVQNLMEKGKGSHHSNLERTYEELTNRITTLEEQRELMMAAAISDFAEADERAALKPSLNI
jgi:ankyrin repeat protein